MGVKQQPDFDTEVVSTPAGLDTQVKLRNTWHHGHIEVYHIEAESSTFPKFEPLVGDEIVYQPHNPDEESYHCVKPRVGVITSTDFEDSNDLPLQVDHEWVWRESVPRFRQDTVHKVLRVPERGLIYGDVMLDE